MARTSVTEHSCVTGILNNEQILSFIIQHYALNIHLLHDNRQIEFKTGFRCRPINPNPMVNG